MQSPFLRFLTFLAFLVLPITAVSAAVSAGELNIYSYRTEQLLKPLTDAYTAKTGVVFNVVHSPKGLAQRLKAEGASSPADVVLTADISRITEIADMDLLAPLNSPIINGSVPQNLRDKGDRWTALSTRARIVVIAKDRVKKGAIRRIEDLAKPEWKGRICSRKGSHVYNRALLASLVVHHGEAYAEQWARGLVDNLARRPQGNDRAQAKAIYAGVCDVAIMNTYYIGKMQFNDEDKEQQDWARSIGVVFLNQNDRGQHINITAGGIVKTSKNIAAARAFLEWLVGGEAQNIYADANYEYPVNPSVSVNPAVAAWGDFKADSVSISAIADASRTAQMIIDRVGW